MSLLGWDDDEDDDAPEPPPVDPVTAAKVAHSFYVVRMARYVALAVALAVVAGVAALGHAPGVVPWVLLGIAVVLVGVALVIRSRFRRWASSRSPRA